MASNSKSVISLRLRTLVEGQKDAAALTRELESLAKASERASRTLAKASFSQFMQNCQAAVISAQGLVSGLDALTKGYGEFDTAMRAVNTMAGKDSAGFGALKDQVSELAKSIPAARDALANGLYQVISNGVPEDNWLSFLEASAKASVGGIADLGGVVTVTSTIIKNYGLAWSEAGAIQDKIQTTAKNGVTSFEQLQAALPRVTGNAASLGVSIDELMGSFATLTGVSGNTAEVSTQLAAIFGALIKPSHQAAKMAEEMGIRFDAAAVKAAGGFGAFLKGIDRDIKAYSKATGKLEQEVYGRLFGSAEALRALIPLTGELADKFDANVAAMASSAGAIDSAFADMSQTTEAKAQLMKNAWAGAIDAIGAAAVKVKPALDFTASLGMTANGVGALGAQLARLAQPLRMSAAHSRALGTALNALAAGRTATAVGTLSRGFKIGAANAKLFAGALKAIPFLALVAGAAAASKAVLGLLDTQSKARKVAADYAAATAEIKNSQKSAEQSANASAAGELARVDLLVKAAGDETRSRKARLAALQELQEKYPAYFSSMSLEETSVGALEQKYKDLSAAIMESAKARAYQSKLEELTRKKLDNEDRLHSIQKAGGEMDTATAARDAANAALKQGQSVFSAGSGTAGGGNRGNAWQVTLASDAQKAVSALEQEVASIAEQNAALDEQIARYQQQVGALEAAAAESTPSGGGGGGGGEGSAAPANVADIIPDIAEVQSRARASLADFDRDLADLRKAYANASQDMLGVARVAIEGIEAERAAFEGLPAELPSWANAMPAQLATIADYTNAIRELERLRETASEKELADINQQIAALKEKRKALESLGLPAAADKTATPASKPKAREAIGAGWSGISSVASGVQQLSKLGDETASAWDKVAAAVNGALSVFDGISAVVALVQQLTGVQKGVTAATEGSAAASMLDAAAKQESAIGSAEVAGSSAAMVGALGASAGAAHADAQAQMTDAAAKAMNAHSWIPFVGIALGVAGVATMIATLLTLPKFAKGGIVSGPTLGLMGEYPGASSNPEVVAPLSKLRDLIEPARGFGKVEFRFRRGALVGALEYQNQRERRLR